MMYQSLGIIEVEGFITAIHVIDQMTKHAFITIKHVEKTGAGLVTIMITGDLASVQAAIEMGSDTAYTLGDVIAVKVIPRPDPKIYGTLLPKDGDLI
jgi:ethanolamine utilization protein EutM